MTNPLVSICVPTRNRASSLAASLQNIREQTYAPLHILISDNASEDGTEALCRELASQDSRIRYVRHPTDIGLHRNHNFCLDEAEGEFVCICHDHDVRDTRIVSRYVAFLGQHPDVGVVCSDWVLIDDTGSTIGIRDHAVPPVTAGLDYITRTMRSGRSSVAIPGAMIRRSALGSARFIDDAPIGFGDFPVWFRLAERAAIGHIRERLWSWRQNQESHSARTIEGIAGDYQYNLERYCSEHLERWPDHTAIVATWKTSIRRFLFWALAYEVALHFRRPLPRDAAAPRTLFEIMDYRLSPEQFAHALAQMKRLRTAPSEYAAFGAMQLLIGLGLMWPLTWMTRHQSTLRRVMKLR